MNLLSKKTLSASAAIMALIGGATFYAIAPVPEPETCAMFLAGLVMAVFMARRSQKDAV
jgi:hypothetical protein